MTVSLDATAVEQVERVLARDRLAMPLPEALVRRLGVESWMLTLDANGKLRGITLFAGALPSPPGVLVTATRRDEAPLDRPFVLPAGGVLVRLLGAPTATGRQLVELALRHDDAAVRAEAVRVAVDAMLHDPALESALLAAVDGIDDGALAGALSGLAGEAATTIASLVAERARGRPLGRRAAQVLERLGH